MITLQAIWDSSTGLLDRFNLKPTPKIARLKLSEELHELDEAIFELADSRKSEPLREDAANECADVLVTLLNLMYANGLTCTELEKALQRTMSKNDAKSAETHEIVGGMIARKKIPQEAQS